MTIYPKVLFTSNDSQFILRGDTNAASFSFQSQIHWWQQLLNISLGIFFPCLRTVEVTVESLQGRRVVFLSNGEFSRLQQESERMKSIWQTTFGPRQEDSPTLIWSQSVLDTRAKMDLWKQDFEMSVHKEAIQEQSSYSSYESKTKLFSPIQIAVDLQALQQNLSHGARPSEEETFRASEQVASALQSVLANPNARDAKQTAKSVCQVVGRFFKTANRGMCQFDALRHLYTLLRRHLKVLNKPEKYSSSQQIGSLMQITWLHGTKASVIKSACTQTEGMLLPSGELKKRSLKILTGEMREGSRSCGINNTSLSGVALRNADTAMRYSRNYQLDPSGELRSYNFFLHEGGCPSDQSRGYEYFLDRGGFSRAIEAFRRVKFLNPELVRHDLESWKTKIENYYADFEKYVFKARPREVFNWHDRYYTSKIHAFICSLDWLRTEVELASSQLSNKDFGQEDSEDLELANIPLVFGSNTLYGTPACFGNAEENIPAAKLGRDIQYVFTPQEHIDRVQALVNRYALQVHVLDMASLEQASKEECSRLGHFMN